MEDKHDPENVLVTVLAAACVGLYLVNLALFFAFHALDRSNHVLRHAVSDYALGPTARLFRLYGAIGTLAALLMAWQFYTAAPSPFTADLPIYLLAMSAARIGLTIFPTDRSGAPGTRVGRLHFLCAALSFAAVTTLVLRASHALFTAPHLTMLQPLWPWLEGTVVTAFIALVIARCRPFQAVFGLCERLFILASALWLLLAAIWFLLPLAD